MRNSSNIDTILTKLRVLCNGNIVWSGRLIAFFIFISVNKHGY